ncbi:MAG: MBL fold metallo-hydrolase [Acidobacteria bacterium]|nr:MBL fold metallo-hydrolase [Acidobacteriota bacterium]
MQKKHWSLFALLFLVGCARSPQDVLTDVSAAMGATNLKTIQFSGSGYIFALGQSYSPNDPWSKFNLKSYTRVVNYETASSQEEIIRTQYENPPRGGGVQPVIGEQRQVFLVSGNYAWNLAGNDPVPAPAAVAERTLQVWLTPHGWVKAAMSNNPTVESPTVNGRRVTRVSFVFQGKFPVSAVINDQNLVEKVETKIANPVLGDMPVEISYSDYQDFNGIKFPARIVQSQGGHPTLEITVNSVQPNAVVDLAAPENVRTATVPPVRVESQKVAEGVWLLAGGSHNSVAVEFQDHVVMIEGPQNEERSEAVIAEAKKLLPNKPIRYLVNTHHHFDHSGGIRTYVAEGATIITHEINKPFYEQTFRAPRTLSPDRLSQSKVPAKFETMTDKHILTDGTRTMELHLTQGSGHNAGLIMAYLPRERLLIEADSFSPPPPGAPPPAVISTYSVNLYENIERLRLAVQRIIPIHGRVVPLADLRRVIGRAS